MRITAMAEVQRPTAVAFDKNGAGVKTLTAWKALADQGIRLPTWDVERCRAGISSAGKAAHDAGSTASSKQILNDVNR